MTVAELEQRIALLTMRIGEQEAYTAEAIGLFGKMLESMQSLEDDYLEALELIKQQQIPQTITNQLDSLLARFAEANVKMRQRLDAIDVHPIPPVDEVFHNLPPVTSPTTTIKVTNTNEPPTSL